MVKDDPWNGKLDRTSTHIRFHDNLGVRFGLDIVHDATCRDGQ